MANPQTNKATSSRKARTPRTDEVRAYEVTGELAGVDLPSGTTVVVIPNSAAAEAELVRKGGVSRWAPTPSVARKLKGIRAMKALREQAIASSAFEPDARARAILRGITYAQDDLQAAGGSYDVDEVRTLLHGVSRQAVDKRIADGQLLSVPGPSGRRRFPTVQFNDDGSIVRGLREVQVALGYSSPWSVLNFLVNPNDRLSGVRPIDALRDGKVELVVRAANSVGVQAA